MKTPIYIDFARTYPSYLSSSELDIYQPDPIDIYTDPNDTLVSTKPYILAPRYFLLIHRPVNQPGPRIRIDLHKSANSLLQNKIRVSLPPSVGYGINASYKVEYFEWFPNLNVDADVTKRKVCTEHWYIPTVSEETYYVPEYPMDPRLNSWYTSTFTIPRQDKPLLEVREVQVDRIVVGTSVYDTITTTDDTDIFCFPERDYIEFKDNISYETLSFNDQTLDWKFSKTLNSSTLVRDSNSVDGALTNGPVTTNITYIKPFHPCQVICKDRTDVLEDSNYYYNYF